MKKLTILLSTAILSMLIINSCEPGGGTDGDPNVIEITQNGNTVSSSTNKNGFSNLKINYLDKYVIVGCETPSGWVFTTNKDYVRVEEDIIIFNNGTLTKLSLNVFDGDTYKLVIK